MKIEMTADAAGFAKGSIVDVDEPLALRMIGRGKARLPGTAPKEPEKPPAAPVFAKKPTKKKAK